MPRAVRMMRYMVCPKTAVDRIQRTSAHFPLIVEAPENATADEILENIFSPYRFAPAHNKQYYIVPMHDDAMLVTCKARQNYDLVVEQA